jgi:glycosyltransferase involved in cell wall biosynthesis
MSDIEIVYLTHNRLELNKVTLPALLNSDPEIDYKVHIVDNASKDGTIDFLKALDHPKIGSISYNDTNKGIAPVTNKFWDQTKATYVGKIDNDILVPKNWIRDIMLRLENAVEDSMGPVTMYHWIDSWADDIDLDHAPIITLKNGSKIIRSSHTGGNYIFHRYLLDKLGKVDEEQGLKGGFTTWQYKANKTIKCGYVFPFQFFRLPLFYKEWDAHIKNNKGGEGGYSLAHERREAKYLLELEEYRYN